MQRFKRSHPTAAKRRLYFSQVLFTDLQDREAGTTSYTVHVLKPDGTDAAGTGTIGQQDATDMLGLMYYEFTAAELATSGAGIVYITKADRETREVPYEVEETYLGTAVTGTLTSGSFTTSLTTATANHWKRCLLRWLSGSLAGQVSKISSYTVTGGVIAIETGMEFTGAPANGDVFEILNG